MEKIPEDFLKREIVENMTKLLSCLNDNRYDIFKPEHKQTLIEISDDINYLMEHYD